MPTVRVSAVTRICFLSMETPCATRLAATKYRGTATPSNGEKKLFENSRGTIKLVDITKNSLNAHPGVCRLSNGLDILSACADQGALSIVHVQEIELAHFKPPRSGVDCILCGRQDGLIERGDFSVCRHPLIQSGLNFCAQA